MKIVNFGFYCGVSIITMGLVANALAGTDSPPGGTQQAVPNSNAAAVNANAITRSALKIGVQACAGRIEQVTNFLGFGPQAGAAIIQPPNNPNQRLTPVSMEVPTQNGAAYVTASFAPNQANGCGATYDAVVFWPERCDAVAGKQFSNFKKTGMLKKDITMLDGGSATKVYLMPAGNGCVAIKKEIVN